MKLFAVRVKEDQQAVGLFWAMNTDQLCYMVDSVCDPAACEYHLINKCAALVAHGGDAPKLGVERATDDDTGELLDGDPLQNHLTPDFAFDDYFVFGVPKGWKPLIALEEAAGRLPSARRYVTRKRRRS